MPIHSISERALSEALTEAQIAHHTYELSTGVADSHWADWYAHHIISRIDAGEAPFADLSNGEWS